MPRLHIFFSALAIAFGSIFLVPAFGATVVGEVQLISGPTTPHRQKPDFSDIVVCLQPEKGIALKLAVAARAQLLQKNKTFSPHVLPILVGTAVDFPNEDPIFHSAFSNYNGQLFDLGLYPPGTTKSVRFRRPGIVRVFCNIHPTMSAVIVVLYSPYFTKAGREGAYQVSNVPPGTYRLESFDERATGKAEEIEIAIPAEVAEVRAPILRISEEGYVPSPHKNKYGLDYAPKNDTAEYGGVPK